MSYTNIISIKGYNFVQLKVFPQHQELSLWSAKLNPIKMGKTALNQYHPLKKLSKKSLKTCVALANAPSQLDFLRLDFLANIIYYLRLLLLHVNHMSSI